MKKIVLLSLAATLTLSADPLVTYLGTKAKGMGGAFTAIANNNSAMYFNPAGLVNFENLSNANITLEGGTGAKYDQEGASIDDRHTTSGSYFFGISSMTPESGFGFAMYSLYDLNLEGGNSNYYKEEVSVMSLSGAIRLINQMYPYGGGLAIGVTGAYASSYSDTDPEILDVGGFFYTVGLKARVLDHRAFKIDLGFNYRSEAELTSDSEYTNEFKGIGVPQETAFGIAGSYGTEFGLFTLALDYKDTGYEEATKDSDFKLRYYLLH